MTKLTHLHPDKTYIYEFDADAWRPVPGDLYCSVTNTAHLWQNGVCRRCGLAIEEHVRRFCESVQADTGYHEPTG